MTNLIESQLADALLFMAALRKANESLPSEPAFGEGMCLWLPSVIPLRPDFEGEEPVAWLVANDFNGYDLTTEKPE